MFKYYLNNQPFEPINTGGFTFDIQLVKDAGAYHYTTELGGKMIFGGAAYEFISKHSDCQKIVLRVEETCKEGTFDIMELSFTNRDCKWNLDLNQVEVEPKANTLYQCLIDNYDIKFNFLEITNIVSTTFERSLEYEYRVLPINVYTNAGVPGFGPPLDPQVFIAWNLFVREIKTTYCQGGEPVQPDNEGGEDWTLLENNCLGRGYSRWYRRPLIFQGNHPDIDGNDFFVTFCTLPCTPATPAITANNEDWHLMDSYELGGALFYFWVDNNAVRGDIKELNNGRLLTDVIDYGLNINCPELNLQSQFLFNKVNPVTGNSPSSTKGIQLHAISDVKDPDATEVATIENITLKEILESYISSKLNCYWYVDENTKRLIIEHYNDLNNEGTFDLTAIDGGKWLRNKNTFEYDNSDIPKAEEFPSLDTAIDFTGVNITYDNPCASGNKAYITDKFYSELESIVGNTEDYPNDGIVTITPDSCTPYGARIENGAITDDYAPNAPQGMANLHEKFWKYYRPFPNGELNFIEQSFSKNKPVKKLQSIQIPLCCFRFFNSRAAFIGNNFTNGQLQSASFNPSTGFIELTIQYE